MKHLFFHVDFSRRWWEFLLKQVHISWIYGQGAKENMSQLLSGHNLRRNGKSLWINAIKAYLWKDHVELPNIQWQPCKIPDFFHGVLSLILLVNILFRV